MSAFTCYYDGVLPEPCSHLLRGTEPLAAERARRALVSRHATTDAAERQWIGHARERIDRNEPVSTDAQGNLYRFVFPSEVRT